MIKRILITGAGGFVGRSAVQYFLDRGYVVRAMIHRKHHDFSKHVNLEVVQGNMNDVVFLKSATCNIDAVIHLAAAKSDEPESYETNVNGAKNLELTALENGVKQIVVLSTLSTKIAKKGVYAETKSKADQVFLNGRVPSTILLSSIIYGDTSSGVFGGMVRFSRLPIVPVIGLGVSVFVPIHVLDIVRALDIALSNPNVIGHVYDIGGPDRISFNDCIRKIGLVINGRVNVPLVHIPIGLGYLVAYAGKVFFKKPPITMSNISGSNQEVVINTEPFFRDFNFVPMRLDEGFRLVVAGEQALRVSKEARLVLGYINHGVGIRTKLTAGDLLGYISALKNYGIESGNIHHPIFKYPWLLGPVDAISRIKYKDSNLQKKLLIAAALIECTPESAGTLLPQRGSLMGSVARSTTIGVAVISKLIIGVILPNRFIKNYVE